MVAYLALFVAIGGLSYAAIELPAKSVGSKQLKKGAVTKSKLKKGAVRTAKIKAGAITSELVKDGSLQAADFAQLPTGPKGDPGTTGSKTVTLPFAGRLFVLGTLRAEIQNCTDNCYVQYGLRVDGVGVSGSLRRLAARSRSGAEAQPVRVISAMSRMTCTVSAAAAYTASWRSAPLPSRRIRQTPSSSLSQPSSRACGASSPSVRSISDLMGIRPPPTGSMTVARSP
jgi:hypothetical protein